MKFMRMYQKKGKSFLFALFLFITFAPAWVNGQNKIIRLEYEKPRAGEWRLSLIPKIKRPKIGLALSGGSALGLSQIGILKALERGNIPIDYIAGTSMGGVIGGLFACGYSAAELEDIALKVDWMDLLSDTPSRLSMFLTEREEGEGVLLKIRFKGFKPYIPQALTSGQKISNLFTNLTMRANLKAKLNFDQLQIPFRAVATDLVTGNEVILSSGDLAEAIRATMAIPLAFTPVERERMLLADGGLVDPVPVEVVKDMGADIVIAVNTSSQLLPVNKIKNPINLISQSINIMTLEKTKEELKKADLVISPDLSNFSSVDFNKAGELIQIGERTADSLLIQIDEIIANKGIEEKETGRFKIEKIEFVGNQNIETGFLESLIQAEENEEISSSEIRKDLEKLYSTGFFEDVYAEIVPESSSSLLSYHLRENPILNQILFENNTVFQDSVLQEKLSNKPREVLNHKILEKDLNSILQFYHQNGYVLADFSKIEFDSTSKALKVFLDEGNISKIEVQGNKRTKSWVIKRNIPVRVGQPYNALRTNQGISNIYATGLFDQVLLNLYSTSHGNVLQIKVKEKNFDFLRLGAHYKDEYEAEGFLEFVDSNLFGVGNEIFGHLQYGGRKQLYSLNFKADRIFKTYLAYKLKLFHSSEKKFLYQNHKEEKNYEEKKIGGTFFFGQHIKRLGTASIETRWERIDFFPQKEKSYRKEISSIILRSLVDTFDKYPFPDRGKYHHLYLEWASEFLGGETNYKKAYTCLESYFPLAKRINFHPKVALGISDKELPLSEKFTIGGKQNFYGLFFEELKGDKMFLLNLALRYKSPHRVYYTVRYDLGNVWTSLESIKFKNLKQGWGIGLAILTPLGPLEFHYGKANKSHRFYFQLGYDF
jgi:NTE family protein